MTNNVNIQILEALGYWDAGPFKSAPHAYMYLVDANRLQESGYTNHQIQSAADYAIGNRLNWEERNTAEARALLTEIRALRTKNTELRAGITEARDHFNRCLDGSRDIGSQGAYACAAEWMDWLLKGDA